MKLLNIAIMQSCNYNCEYCTMKQWTYPIDAVWDNGTRVNSITNEALLKWLDEYIDPKEWIIKITGGEPGLYLEIDNLIPELEQRGYKGLIETNGSLSIPKSESFIRLAAWHLNRDFPQYYDTILIIKNDKDKWGLKEEYCIELNIPYVTVMLREKNSLYDVPGDVEHTKLDGLLMMYSSGGLQLCPTVGMNYGSIHNMDKPEPKTLIEGTPCITCPQVQMIDYFFSDIIEGDN